MVLHADEVYAKVKSRTKDAILRLVTQEREGESVDRSLLKNVLSIYIDVGSEQMDCYKDDFEKFLFENTAIFYKQKAATWIQVIFSTRSYHLRDGIFPLCTACCKCCTIPICLHLELPLEQN